MKRASIALLVALAAASLPISAAAGETARTEAEALRAEMAELRAVVRELTAQVKAMDRRLSRLENADASRSARPGSEEGKMAPASVTVPESIERGMMMDPVIQRNRLRRHLQRYNPEAPPARQVPPIPGIDEPGK